MRRLAATTLSLGLLAACSTPNPTFPPAGMVGPQIAYLCEDKTTVYITEHVGDDAKAVLADGTELILPQFVSRGGFQYGTATHEFRGGGTTALWSAPGKPPTICRQKP
jgi:membrane-bound inhibitor of C-type lysozyme